MQFTKYGVTLHNSYLSMPFTDFKAALKSLAVEMPDRTSLLPHCLRHQPISLPVGFQEACLAICQRNFYEEI